MHLGWNSCCTLVMRRARECCLDPHNLQAILAAASPQIMLELRGFLGICPYHEEFVKRVYGLRTATFPAVQASPGCSHGHKSVKNVFDERILANDPVLERPDSFLTHILHTDRLLEQCWHR